jgi:hypothetical protein
MLLHGFIPDSGPEVLSNLLVHHQVQPGTETADRLVVVKGRQVTETPNETVLGHFIGLFGCQAATAAMLDDGKAIKLNELTPSILVFA